MHETEQQTGKSIDGGAAGMAQARDPRPHTAWLKLLGHDLFAPALLLLLALFMFVPGQSAVPPLDRDEPRFTQATKQMLETGDYMDIRLQEEPRYKKPIGIYWLQAAAVKITGHDASAPLWVYRLPSLLAALTVVLAVYWTARAFTGPPAALVAAMLVALALILGVESRLGKTDATLFASIVLAQGALARIYLADDATRRHWGLALVFWVALALGILVKGPVAPMVVGLTVAALALMRRRIGWFRAAAPLPGAVLALLLVLPWFVAIWIASKGTFFEEAIGRDLMGKVAEGQESHGAPPLTHLAAMLVVFWPLPAFLTLAAPRIWALRSLPLVQFCAAWFFPAWVVFELVATKLPHYTMPLLPALALPVALVIVDERPATGRVLRWIAAVLLALLPVAIAAASVAGPLFLGDWPSPPGVVFCVIAAVISVWASIRLLRGDMTGALWRSSAAAVAMTTGFWGFVGPGLSTIWVSPRLVVAISEGAGCTPVKVASTGFSEPSFVFLQGTDTLLGGAEQSAAFLAQDPAPCRAAVVESRQEQAFLDAASKDGLVPVLAGRVQGLNINGGRQLDLGIYVPGASAR
ncbi:ArnT family glycosyltransferase [Pannonibacter phragmitetus]|uniref:ArnT family glycosyltransferase n=1 Tax=Pannonibacter phragmitetus TaxID=121719 RepID=UPI000F02CACC|nr:glycosyltransferase family 39 protein [Pannonibacter phragmitetus]